MLLLPFHSSIDIHLEDVESREHLLHSHDQKWMLDGLKVEIIISGGRADLSVKAKNHGAAELKHESWREHRQVLQALYCCLIRRPFVGNLVGFFFFLVRKQLCVSNLTFAFIISSIPVIFTKLATSHVFMLIFELVFPKLSSNLQIGGTVHTDWESRASLFTPFRAVN